MAHGEVAAFSRIDAAARQAWERDGVVRLAGVLGGRSLELAETAVQWGLAHPGPFFRDHTPPGSRGRYVFDFWTWRENRALRELVLGSPAASLVGALIGARRLRMVMDNWFVRERGSLGAAPWHHDEPYFDFEGRLAILWMPLEPVAPEEGLRFVRGSHRWGRLFAASPFSDSVPFTCSGPRYEPLPDVEGAFGDRILGSALEPGDCLVFDFRTLHAAACPGLPAPRTSRRLTLRFGAEGVRFRPRGEWTRVISTHLEREGQVPGQVLDNPLTPEVWRAPGLPPGGGR